MIVNGPTVPDVFGASSPKGNYADMSTYGYELSLEWRDGFDLAGKRFNYSIKGTLADYYSVIDRFNNANMSLSEYANQSLDKNYYEGMRIGEIWDLYPMVCGRTKPVSMRLRLPRKLRDNPIIIRSCKHRKPISCIRVILSLKT